MSDSISAWHQVHEIQIPQTIQMIQTYELINIVRTCGLNYTYRSNKTRLPGNLQRWKRKPMLQHTYKQRVIHNISTRTTSEQLNL